jgi:hypothetical protein
MYTRWNGSRAHITIIRKAYMTKKLHYFRIPVAFLFVLITVLGIMSPTPVFAIANPTTGPTIGTATCYDSLLETGDMGMLLDFSIGYATLPTETVTEAYRVAFCDTDGVTELKTVVPYTLLNKGYQPGTLAWIYFTAAEVTTYSISSADIALYRVVVYGNPALGWVPGPNPVAFDTIDTWNTTGVSTTLLALDVLNYVTTQETAWSLDMYQTTSLGKRLTIYGETYIEGVITNARNLCPNAFYIDIVGPINEEIDYTTEFGATITDITGACTGSPITLSSGPNTVHIITGGTFIIELTSGTSGTAASVVGGGAVTGSPVTLVSGLPNTITATNAGTGNILITVQLVNTQTQLEDTVTGTGFDLTAVATAFGMSRSLFSGFIWLIISIIICAAAYARVGGKTTLLVFELCIIGGALLGLMPVLVAALMFIGMGALTAYVFFFRNANA